MNVHLSPDSRLLPPDDITRTCPFGWCQVTEPGHDEHDTISYVPASLSTANTTIGAGVAVEPDGTCVITTHISDDVSADVDAHMTVGDALAFVDVLTVAISRARSVEAGKR